MSLINEALKRSESDKLRNSSPYFNNLTVMMPEGDDVPPPITELAEGKLFEGDLQPVGSEPRGEKICGLIAGGRRRITGGKRLQRLYRLLEILPGDLLDNPAQEVAFPV